MLAENMTVEKKSNEKNKKRLEIIFHLDCFVDKTGPVRRLAVLDVADIEQRT
jgi:hypothetical protein